MSAARLVNVPSTSRTAGSRATAKPSRPPYARLAAGSIDLVVESQLKPHDYNALIPVVRGAGGVVTDWRGGDDFSGRRLVAAAGRALLGETLGLLGA